MDERAVPALGKLSVVLRAGSALEFADVPETYLDELADNYRGKRPFLIKGTQPNGRRRNILQFPNNPPSAVAWDEKGQS